MHRKEEGGEVHHRGGNPDIYAFTTSRFDLSNRPACHLTTDLRQNLAVSSSELIEGNIIRQLI